MPIEAVQVTSASRLRQSASHPSSAATAASAETQPMLSKRDFLFGAAGIDRRALRIGWGQTPDASSGRITSTRPDATRLLLQGRSRSEIRATLPQLYRLGHSAKPGDCLAVAAGRPRGMTCWHAAAPRSGRGVRRIHLGVCQNGRAASASSPPTPVAAARTSRRRAA